MKVLFAPQALEDLTATVEYIAQDDPQAAVRLADRVFEIVDRLAEGELDEPEQRLRSGEPVRSWPVPPLRIYYQRAPDNLAVLRIYHQARDPIAR